mmetsp:Transcript_34691/g.82275  ORF Transcript_34691/g.82275 Transcript_34691/m.82275 type:complete len:222 (-) Transcript_34691:173-838(-)
MRGQPPAGPLPGPSGPNEGGRKGWEGGKEGRGVSAALGSVDVLRQPTEAIAVAHAPDHAAHEDLDRAHVGVRELHRALARGVVREAEAVAQLVLRGRRGDVDLVAEHQEGHVGKVVVREEPVKLLLRLEEPLLVGCIHEEDNCVHLRIVVLPNFACNLVTTQVKSTEVDSGHLELLRRRVLGRLVLCKALVFQHMHQRCFPSVIKTQEQNLRILIVESKRI